MAETRTPRNLNSRDTESRDSDTRPRTWAPASVLPTPNQEPGYVMRWVRISTNGDNDPMNLSARLREGWEPVKASDHPELKLFTSSVTDNRVEIGGLVLCKMPAEMVEQRNAHYRGSAQRQMEAADNNLMSENDPRMPLFKERESRVSFGSD